MFTTWIMKKVIKMKSRKISAEILQYIETNLAEQLTVNQIAKKAGYSEYYFSHLFKKEMGISVMDYIIKRKLVKASEYIISGDNILDTALNFGWQTHAGFTKSFKRAFGFSPCFLKILTYEIDYYGGKNMKHIFLDSLKPGVTKEFLFETLITKIQEHKPGFDTHELKKIYHYALTVYDGRKRYSGEDYITHPLNVSILLSDLNADKTLIYAGLLCDALKKGAISVEEAQIVLPSPVLQLIIELDNFDFQNLDTASEDVILLKLAERLHNMRTLQFMNENEWKKKAKETLEFYIPLALRLENQKLTNELEHLCMKYMDFPIR